MKLHLRVLPNDAIRHTRRRQIDYTIRRDIDLRRFARLRNTFLL